MTANHTEKEHITSGLQGKNKSLNLEQIVSISNKIGLEYVEAKKKLNTLSFLNQADVLKLWKNMTMKNAVKLKLNALQKQTLNT